MTNKSFINPAELEKNIRAQKDQEKKAEAAAADTPAKATPEAEQQPVSMVFSFRRMRDVPDTELLDGFKDLGEQVRDKGFLLRGYATIERKIWGQTVRFRTLRKSENRLINTLAEESGRVNATKSLVLEEQTRWFAVFMIQQFGGETFTDIAAPRVFGSTFMADQTRETLRDFVIQKDVVKRLDFFESLPREIYDDLVAHCVDMLTAMSKFIERDLRNP